MVPFVHHKRKADPHLAVVQIRQIPTDAILVHFNLNPYLTAIFSYELLNHLGWFALELVNLICP